MWVEAILSKADLDALAVGLCPVNVLLGGRGELRLHTPREVSLVPDVGVRVACDASMVWPALGYVEPVAFSLGALLRLEIETWRSGDALVFDVAIEDAHIPGAPQIRFERIVESLNCELAEQRVERSWSLSRLLRHTLRLSDFLEPALALDLEVSWGSVRVTADAMVLAISFRSAVTRQGESGAIMRSQSQWSRVPENRRTP
jgi:hypothetical protein